MSSGLILCKFLIKYSSHSLKKVLKNVFALLWLLGEYILAVGQTLLCPSLKVVIKYLPSLSLWKDIVSKFSVDNVMTPLLPPVPQEIFTFPFHMFSNSIRLALCVSCRNIIALDDLIFFLILPIACNSRWSLVSPLQLIVMLL